jgi:hypothetical protein
VQNYLTSSGLTTNDCVLNSIVAQWYVDIRYNGTPLIIEPFAITNGYSNYPTNQQWIDGLNNTFTALQNDGYTYYIDEDNETITVFNVNCIPINVEDIFEINVGINFVILCNQ